MKKATQRNDVLASKILTALTLLDQKGVNDSITQAMSIVYEAFHRHAAQRSFSANDLFRAAQ